MQETMDFYIHLGFEARDVLQEGDDIISLKMIYRDNEDVTVIFKPLSIEEGATYKGLNADFILRIEESANELPEHFKARYGAPKQLSIKDPNGYQLEFVRV